MRIPNEIGLIHFIGIGGIGMSAIAELLNNLGYSVQGSDTSEGKNVTRLKGKGIKVSIGHRAENIGESEVVVISTAIKAENPEYAEAKERHLLIVSRAEMLAALMRFRQTIVVAGTHGKTTTTSMVGQLLEIGGLDPIIINGGILNAIGTNARMGEGIWMVVEADESDGSFLKLPADVVIITNIDSEHLDYYGTFKKAKEAFQFFVEKIPFYGFGVMCIDNPEVRSLIRHIEDRRIITYGHNPRAEVHFHNVRFEETHCYFDIIIRDRKRNNEISFKDFLLPMLGIHNVTNATASIAVAHQLGISEEAMRHGLKIFKGVERRFTLTGVWKGIRIFDDYAHHPVEIAAVLKAARMAAGFNKGSRVIVIQQPHRYTRLNSLFDDFCLCFNDADTVLVAPVYEAGENPIEGIHSEALVSGLKLAGHRDARLITGTQDIAPIISSIAKEGDYVIFLGAGDITFWAHSLPNELASFS
ncbi:UDP-N-acetylmuramate--L-alanine ligase [Candidatus Endowatersipora endosymbiont of Watersipora subatra]|uniref:UDP-N-acetylmuramate--L-alanine ligase n=1 Tax=Candidatus Endowatersipora endosymbiont of Watersipora subatra TaxID=3077946 RepID=UPI00312CAD72